MSIKTMQRDMAEMLTMITDPEAYLAAHVQSLDEAEERLKAAIPKYLARVDYDRELKVRTRPDQFYTGKVCEVELSHIERHERSVTAVFRVTLVCGTLNMKRVALLKKLPLIR